MIQCMTVTLVLFITLLELLILRRAISQNIPVWNEILFVENLSRSKHFWIFGRTPRHCANSFQSEHSKCWLWNGQYSTFTDTLDLFIFDDVGIVPIKYPGVDPTTKADKPITPSLSIMRAPPVLENIPQDFLNLDKMVLKYSNYRKPV